MPRQWCIWWEYGWIQSSRISKNASEDRSDQIPD